MSKIKAVDHLSTINYLQSMKWKMIGK